MCRIPWWQGKMQGISPIRPFSVDIRLENICEFSDLRMNSLCDRAGNLFARAGNWFGLLDRSREFAAWPEALIGLYPVIAVCAPAFSGLWWMKRVTSAATVTAGHKGRAFF